LAQQLGTDVLEEAMGLAFENRNLELLKQLFAARPARYNEGQGMPNPNQTVWKWAHLNHAAHNGYVECIEFAVTHTCPWWGTVRGSNLGHVSKLFLDVFFWPTHLQVML
jgi:hypothetical protein